MRTETIIVAAIVGLVALGGGAAVVVSKKRVRRALREAGVKQDVDPDILDALGYVESRWRLSAVNMSGSDGARGGAWGPTQITERTARAHGYTGPMSAFTKDPDLAAYWTAKIMRARPGGPPERIEDASAWWNAGRRSAASLDADHITRVDYIPKAIAALEKVRGSPLV